MTFPASRQAESTIAASGWMRCDQRPISVRYPIRLSGSNGALLVFADERDAVGHRRPVPLQAASQAPDLEVAIERAVGRLPGQPGPAKTGAMGAGPRAHVVTVDGLDALASWRQEHRVGAGIRNCGVTARG